MWALLRRHTFASGSVCRRSIFRHPLEPCSGFGVQPSGPLSWRPRWFPLAGSTCSCSSDISLLKPVSPVALYEYSAKLRHSTFSFPFSPLCVRIELRYLQNHPGCGGASGYLSSGRPREAFSRARGRACAGPGRGGIGRAPGSPGAGPVLLHLPRLSLLPSRPLTRRGVLPPFLHLRSCHLKS